MPQSTPRAQAVYIDPVWQKVVPGWSRSHPMALRSSRAVNIRKAGVLATSTTSQPVLKTQSLHTTTSTTTPSSSQALGSSTSSSIMKTPATGTYEHNFPAMNTAPSSTPGTYPDWQVDRRPDPFRSRDSPHGKEVSGIQSRSILPLDRYVRMIVTALRLSLTISRHPNTRHCGSGHLHHRNILKPFLRTLHFPFPTIRNQSAPLEPA
jgi:hypothetical protein